MPKTFINPSLILDPKSPLFKQLLVGVSVFLLMAQGANSEELVDAKSDHLNLKLEDQLLVRPIVPDDLSPTFTSSKKLDGVMDRQMRLEGGAVIRRGRTVIKGDVIVYDPDTDIADIKGNATLLKDSTYFKGTEAKLQLDAQEGWMEKPDYELRDIGGYGNASRVDFKEGGEFELEKLRYSTCRPENLDWYLTASRMDVEQDTKSAVGTNAVLHFFNVPVLYTPVFALPVGSERRSGFLSPTYGTVSRGGVKGWDITLPYYVNIAPNRDMTLFPRYIEGRGEQLGGEFRYLDRNYSGVVTAEVLDDAAFGKNRWAFGLKHTQNLATGLVGYTDFNKVSDDFYVDDLGKSLNGVINRQFNQEVGTRYANNGWSILSRFQSFQTLLPDPLTAATESLPYDREPQVNAKYAKNNWNSLNFTFESDATRFTYKGAVKDNRKFSAGNRAYAVTSVAKPMMTPGSYLTPKLTVRSTQYSVDPFPGQPDLNRNVTLPTFSLDSGLVFERDALELTSIFNRNILMTLEPRAFYVYTPYRYQADLPLFDTADSGFGISQIFSENTFVGNDRVADNNKVTIGVTSRILDADTGIERLRGVLAQRIDMEGQRVGLTANQAQQSKRSDLLAGFSTRLIGNFNLDGLAQYNEQISKVVQQSVTASYRPEVKKLVNVSYKRTVDVNKNATTDQYEVSGQWPIARQWYGVARYNYDLISNRILNRVAGLEYDADCWVMRLVQRRYQNTSVMATSEIYMQIDFKGFSGFGNNSIDLIRFNIPGYEPVSPNPAPISPFESYE